jgi:hypothetical protein
LKNYQGVDVYSCIAGTVTAAASSKAPLEPTYARVSAYRNAMQALEGEHREPTAAVLTHSFVFDSLPIYI